MKKIEPLGISDLIDLTVSGGTIPASRALATFANPSNWKQIYGGKNHSGYEAKHCEWAFIGPVRPPYELAQKAIEQLEKKIQENETIESTQS